MKLTHSFTVPADLEQAWDVLLDIERIAPCMPGAALESVDGDDFTGSVKVRLGPIGLTYKGKASFVIKDADHHRAVIDAQAKDTRGNGTAKATITATLTGTDSGTTVQVVTSLNITGKPAQFGRGVMVDVGNKLIQQFADCLAGKLAESEGGAAEPVDVADGVAADAVAPDAGAADAVAPDAGVELGSVDPEVVERLAAADLEGAEQLGTVEPEDPAPAAGPGLAEPALVETGLAGLQEPSVTPDSAVAGPGLANPGPAGTAAAPAEAVTEPAGTATAPAVEPAAAAEQAPAAQRVDDDAALSDPAAGPGALLGQGFAPAPTPEHQSPSAQELAPSNRPSSHRPASEVEPIDLLGSAGPALAKRLAPLAAGIVLVVLLLSRRRRH